MAKLKAPLLSLGASGQVGKSLVYFGWKGLDCVREYVIPSNPRSTGQTTHRGYLTAIVTLLHAAQNVATNPVDEDDKSAYSLWGSIFATPRTWFNQVVKNAIDQRVASLQACVFRDGTTTPGADQLTVEIWRYKTTPNDITTGRFWWGTSKTGLISSKAATIVADKASTVISSLTTGVKYYWQYRPTAHADYVGTRSGIYYGTPT